jgi:guanylate kinase
MNKKLNKSIIVTGASVAGKTTLCRRLMVHFELEPLPVHMTRESRNGEIENVDAIFINEDEFKSCFQKGYYLQDSLEASFFSGSYYGCPKKWLYNTKDGKYHCFVCPTVKMAKEIKEALGKKIFWIHLITNEHVRLERLMRRNPNMKKEYFDARINKGNASVDIAGHDLLIDTSYLNAWEIFFNALTRL